MLRVGVARGMPVADRCIVLCTLAIYVIGLIVLQRNMSLLQSLSHEWDGKKLSSSQMSWASDAKNLVSRGALKQTKKKSITSI